MVIVFSYCALVGLLLFVVVQPRSTGVPDDVLVARNTPILAVIAVILVGSVVFSLRVLTPKTTPEGFVAVPPGQTQTMGMIGLAITELSFLLAVFLLVPSNILVTGAIGAVVLAIIFAVIHPRVMQGFALAEAAGLDTPPPGTPPPLG